jgi:hypothetical protein
MMIPAATNEASQGYLGVQIGGWFTSPNKSRGVQFCGHRPVFNGGGPEVKPGGIYQWGEVLYNDNPWPGNGMTILCVYRSRDAGAPLTATIYGVRLGVTSTPPPGLPITLAQAKMRFCSTTYFPARHWRPLR